MVIRVTRSVRYAIHGIRVMSESRAESALWRALLREGERRDSPLQMWLLLDQLIAERGKRK